LNSKPKYNRGKHSVESKRLRSKYSATSKHSRGQANIVNCNIDPCSDYVSNNSIQNTFNMGLVTLNIAGSDSITKTLTIYSNTSSEQLFTATWNIGDSLYNDSPTTQTDWNAFKSAYVTAGGAKDELTIDLAQWASDDGTAGGELHSYTITTFCNSAECQSDLYSNTISVAATSSTQVPATPLNLTLEGVNNGFEASWDSVTDAVSYVLAYKESTQSTYTEEPATSLTSLTILSLTIDSDYNVKVKARNSAGDSAYTSPLTVTAGLVAVRETDAERHYLLGNDNTGYYDIDGTNALTKLGQAHSTESGYAVTFPSPATTGAIPSINGLQTNVTDLSTEQTVIVVGMLYDDVPDSSGSFVAQGACLLGNITTSGTNGGVGIFEQKLGSPNAGELFINSRGTGSFNYIETPSPDNWFFLAYSLSTNNRKVFFQDSTMSTPTIIDQTATVTVSSPTRGIGFGNVSYDDINYNNGMNIAEGIIINSSKTDAELAAIRTRSISRLSGRGVTL